MENNPYLKGRIAAIVLLLLFCSCKVKKEAFHQETKVVNDTSYTNVVVNTVDSVHTKRVFVYTDSAVTKRLTIKPVGEFSWNPTTGFKGHASELELNEELDYLRIHNSMDSIKKVIIDSLSSELHLLNSRYEVLKHTKHTSDPTPWWVYVVFVICITGVVYYLFR